jgi:hypothetical protein
MNSDGETIRSYGRPGLKFSTWSPVYSAPITTKRISDSDSVGQARTNIRAASPC